MKKLIALVVCLAAVACIAASDAPPRKVSFVNMVNLHNRDGSAWVQADGVAVVENGPGFVRFRYPNGKEYYYSGSYLISY